MHCVGLDKPPDDDKKWYCPECLGTVWDPNKSARGEEEEEEIELTGIYNCVDFHQEIFFQLP